MEKNRSSHTETRRMERIHRTLEAPAKVAQEPVQESVRPTQPGRDLLRNLTVASALVLCVVALRAGAVPSLNGTVDAVLTAASGDTLLDDQLGKLSFVSSIFPEAALVFGESSEGVLSMPVTDGQVVHAWSEQEPYTSWQTDSQTVVSAIDGEVRGVYHGNGDELLVQVAGDGGLVCVYGNLAACSVAVGDAVAKGAPVGTLLPGTALAFEVRQDGYSVDPAAYLPSVQ